MKFTTKMVSLSIDLDRETKLYFSGEALTGQAAVISREPCEIKRLSMLLLGETKTGWFESKTMSLCKSHEVNLKIEQNLTDALQYLLAENETLPGETYKVPFKFVLPRDLPSSIKCDLGWTRYRCILKANEDETEVAFTVIAHIPLEYHQNVEQPRWKIDECNQTGVSGFEGTLQGELQLPKLEYSVGESINPAIVVNKKATTPVLSLGLGLVQDVLVQSEDGEQLKTKSAWVSRLLVEKTISHIDHSTLKTFHRSLRIPISTPPSRVGDLISIRYRIALVGDRHVPSKISVPIAISNANVMPAAFI